MRKYILGVDGGNTKTDYFLFDTEGMFIDFFRDGTCSHEALKDGFIGTERIMRKAIEHLLDSSHLKPFHIASAVFGLAGVDTPSQKKRAEDVITRLGFKNFRVVNDSFLGIKALGEHGVCSVCGTATSAGGIDPEGNVLQVGGIGAIAGDEAGGSWLARRAVRETFDALYRFGRPSSLNKIVLDELKVTKKSDLMNAIANRFRNADFTRLAKGVFEGAEAGDAVCRDILKEMADNLARSAGGCIVNLAFGERPRVVLVGSVWVKGSSPILRNEFKKKIDLYTERECDVELLTIPPAAGAVIWALELATGSFPDQKTRDMIIKQAKEKEPVISRTVIRNEEC